MAQGNTYDPAESIKESFQQASTGIGNIFANILTQKQRDYALAEDAYNNIEALKKNLNIWGMKDITNKSNALLAKASSIIKEDGKIDYSRLGEIRQEISNIKDDKTGYELGAQYYDKMMQLGIANKDNLTSFEAFMRRMNSTMADPNLIRNPDGLVKAMNKAYDDSLDLDLMVQKSYSKFRPFGQTSVEHTDAKGNLVKTEAYLPAGWTVDPNTKKVVPPITVVKGADGQPVINPNTGKPMEMDYVSEYMNSLKTSDPELLSKIMARNPLVTGTTVNGDYIAVKALLDRAIPNQKFSVSTLKTKAEQEVEALKPEATKVQIQAAKEGILTSRQQRRTLKSTEELNNAKRDKVNASGASGSPIKKNVYVDSAGHRVEETPLPTPVEMDFPKIKYQGKDLGKVEVLSMFTRQGQRYAKVAKTTENSRMQKTREYVNVKLDNESYNFLNNRLYGMAAGAKDEGASTFGALGSEASQPTSTTSEEDFYNKGFK